MLLYWRHGVELFLPIERVLWIVSLCAEALVVARLLRERLLGKYPLLAAFLTAEMLCSVIVMQISITSRNYAQAYRICSLILAVFRLGVAAELYERICQHFPGIGKFRAALGGVLVALSALVAAFTVRPNLVDQWSFPQTMVVVVQRFQSEILAAALILTWIFLRFVLSIRQPFRPNVLTHWRIATAYFGVSGAANLAILLTGGGTLAFPINSAMLVAHLICFLAWFRLLRRAGEQMPDFERLSAGQIQQVDRYNRALMDTVKSLPGEISAR